MMQFLWWHWVMLGVVLTLLELAVPAFFLLWFGAGAVVVDLVLLAFPQLSFTWQIVAWIGCAVAFIWLWFKVFKPGSYKTRAGMSKGELIGAISIVIRDIRPYDGGRSGCKNRC